MAALSLGVATGCSDANDPQTLLEDYVARVENVTESKPSADGEFESALLGYPGRRDLRLPLTDLRINMLEFFGLMQCGLQEIVGERNSSLGKVMPVSRQLIYEHRLLVGARRCRLRLEDAGNDTLELRQTLDEVVELKAAELPRAYWNATFASPEFAHMFSLAAPPMRIDAANRSDGEIDRALAYLTSLGDQLGKRTLELKSARLEAHYRALTSSRLTGELMGAIELLSFHLDAAARAIEARLNRRPICYDRRPTPKARIMLNVFNKYYVMKVQPYLARVHARTQAWLERLDRLTQVQQVQMPPAFKRYFTGQLSLDAPESAWSQYRRALRHHTEAWQSALGQCGLMPGQT